MGLEVVLRAQDAGGRGGEGYGTDALIWRGLGGWARGTLGPGGSAAPGACGTGTGSSAQRSMPMREAERALAWTPERSGRECSTGKEWSVGVRLGTVYPRPLPPRSRLSPWACLLQLTSSPWPPTRPEFRRPKWGSLCILVGSGRTSGRGLSPSLKGKQLRVGQSPDPQGRGREVVARGKTCGLDIGQDLHSALACPGPCGNNDE